MNVDLNVVVSCVVNLLQGEFDIKLLCEHVLWIGGGRREAGNDGVGF